MDEEIDAVQLDEEDREAIGYMAKALEQLNQEGPLPWKTQENGPSMVDWEEYATRMYARSLLIRYREVGS